MQLLAPPVFRRCHIKILLKISVEASQGRISAFVGTLNDRQIGIFHEITSMAQTIMTYISVKGDAYSFAVKS